MTTKTELKLIYLVRYSTELLDCHCGLMYAQDIVGPKRYWSELDWYRPMGLLLRRFETHQDHLAEFQVRLDYAKQRAARDR